MRDLTEEFVGLIRRTSTDLPQDVEQSLVAPHGREGAASAAESGRGTVLWSVALAAQTSTRSCQ